MSSLVKTTKCKGEWDSWVDRHVTTLLSTWRQMRKAALTFSFYATVLTPNASPLSLKLVLASLDPGLNASCSDL